MNRLKYFEFLLMAIAIFAVVTAASAQDVKPPDDQSQNIGRPGPQPNDVRANILRQLGLSPEQIQKIRRLNIQRKPQMDAAQKNMQDAMTRLDDAIYADVVNDQDVFARIKEVQLAQSELQRLRFTNEFAVRQILTPEQLIRFREIRKRFAEERERVNTIRRNGNVIDGATIRNRQQLRKMRQNANPVTKKPDQP